MSRLALLLAAALAPAALAPTAAADALPAWCYGTTDTLSYVSYDCKVAGAGAQGVLITCPNGWCYSDWYCEWNALTLTVYCTRWS